MRAIVCDKCGKVVLLDEDERDYSVKQGTACLLIQDGHQTHIDLCEECARELMDVAIRKG